MYNICLKRMYILTCGIPLNKWHQGEIFLLNISATSSTIAPYTPPSPVISLRKTGYFDFLAVLTATQTNKQNKFFRIRQAVYQRKSLCMFPVEVFYVIFGYHIPHVFHRSISHENFLASAAGRIKHV